MSKDRELLELAAKACGIRIKFFNSNGHSVIAEDGGGPESCLVTIWNPLVDDGQALRLMVALCLDINFYPSCGEVEVVRETQGVSCEPFKRGGGPESTRRAIVRAAAEIGRSMK